MITLSIEGADILARRFGISLVPTIRTITFAVGEALRGYIAVYPGPAHKPVKWASVRQRRWWFAHRREKGLPLGYTRNSDPESQQLGKSWATRHDGQMNAVLGTRATYAPWVQASERTPHGGPQSEQHAATGWVTDKIATEKLIASGDVREIAVQAVMKALRGDMV